jgi:hypothetical protein
LGVTKTKAKLHYTQDLEGNETFETTVGGKTFTDETSFAMMRRAVSSSYRTPGWTVRVVRGRTKNRTGGTTRRLVSVRTTASRSEPSGSDPHQLSPL